MGSSGGPPEYINRKPHELRDSTQSQAAFDSEQLEKSLIEQIPLVFNSTRELSYVRVSTMNRVPCRVGISDSVSCSPVNRVISVNMLAEELDKIASRRHCPK